METGVVSETSVGHIELQGLHHLRQSSTSGVVIGRCRFAAGGPTLQALLTADHSGKKPRLLHRISASGVGGAQFKNPASGLGGLQVADTNRKVLFPEVCPQMTGFGQQRIADGDAWIAIAGTHQRQCCDLLQTGTAEERSETAFRLLCRRQRSWGQGIRQMGAEAIKSHEACDLFNQIDLAGQVEPSRRGSNDIPSLIARAEFTTEGRQTLLDYSISQVGTALLILDGSQQLMQGVTAQQHGTGVSSAVTTDPEALGFTGKQLFQQLQSTD